MQLPHNSKTPLRFDGRAGSLDSVNLLGSLFWGNSIIQSIISLGQPVKTLCITIGFCAHSPHNLAQTNRLWTLRGDYA